MRTVLLVAAVLAFGLAGCAEREQVSEAKPGDRYQGKHDTKPWNNEPLAYGSGKWSKGDRASWETQIKTRQQAQNEDKRIYQ